MERRRSEPLAPAHMSHLWGAKAMSLARDSGGIEQSRRNSCLREVQWGGFPPRRRGGSAKEKCPPSAWELKSDAEILEAISAVMDRICALSTAQLQALKSGAVAESERLREDMRILLEIHRGLCQKFLGRTIKPSA